MSDTKQTPPSPDDADVAREVRLGRKFSLSEALGQIGGKGILKGESPIAPLHQTEAEIANYLRAHLKDSGGVLAEVVLRHMRTSEVLLTHVHQPMVVLVSYVNQVLQSAMLLKDLVREADAEWGRAYDERPYFEREGQPSYPDDPYTLASVHDALRQLVERATRDDEER
jgi:hypothetical protein